jgi:hypothetical protein
MSFSLTDLRHGPPPFGGLENVLLAGLELAPQQQNELAVAHEQSQMVTVLCCRDINSS